MRTFSPLLTLVILSLLPCTTRSPAQSASPAHDLTGNWTGALDVYASKLRLVLEVSKKGTKYHSVLKSLDQGGQPIPCNKTTFVKDEANVEVAVIQGGFSGKLSADGNTLTGTWKQGPALLPLVLTRTKSAPARGRPQEPKPPFPYLAEEVTYASQQPGVTLAGTLTLPEGKGPFPAALLITGSGPQNRNEEVAGHKPFLVLADYLTRQGIAVLRSDDRGVGKSTGVFATSTSADFTEDVRGGIAYLKTRKEIDPKKIGLIGHSEGGLIAPMVAVGHPDVAFIVLMAGPCVPGDEILLEQSALVSMAAGETAENMALTRRLNSRVFAIAKSEPDNEKASAQIKAFLDAEIGKLPEAKRKEIEAKRAELDQSVSQVLTPWFRFFINYDPRTSLRKLTCPTLAINGEKDLQVPPKQSLPEIEKAFKESGNTHLTVRELPSLNHLFQTAKTGAPTEYDVIEETIAPIALQTMGDWIQSVVK